MGTARLQQRSWHLLAIPWPQPVLDSRSDFVVAGIEVNIAALASGVEGKPAVANIELNIAAVADSVEGKLAEHAVASIELNIAVAGFGNPVDDTEFEWRTQYHMVVVVVVVGIAFDHIRIRDPELRQEADQADGDRLALDREDRTDSGN